MSQHVYQFKAGQLIMVTGRNVYVGVRMTFYIWEKKTRIAAYCAYESFMSDAQTERFEKAVADNVSELRRIGIGRANAVHTISLTDPIDMKGFKGDGMTGGLSFDVGDGQSSSRTATIKLDKGHVNLPFLVLASLSTAVPLNTRGTIYGTTTKTRHPKLPSKLTVNPADVHPSEDGK